MAGSITIQGLDKVSRKLQRLEAFQQWARQPMEDTQAAVIEEARKMPRKSGTFTDKATPGQKRAYWAKVRSGEARHGANGYIRSGKLERSWKALSVENMTSGLRGTVTNDSGYGVYVMGRFQQPFHTDSGFRKEQALVNDVDAGPIWAAAINRELNR